VDNTQNPQVEKPKAQPQATEQPQKTEQPKPNQQKQPEKKNRSLFGGKLYGKIGEISKGITDFNKKIIDNFDKSLEFVSKKGPVGKKLADNVRKTLEKAKQFEQKHPAIYSMVANMALGSIAAGAGAAVGNMKNQYVLNSQIEEINAALEKAKIEVRQKMELSRMSNGSIENPIDVDNFVADKAGEYLANTSGKDIMAVQVITKTLTPEQLKTFNELLADNKTSIKYSESISDIKTDVAFNTVVGGVQGGDITGQFAKGSFKYTMDKFGLQAPVVQGLMTLANPSPSALGQVAFAAVINALDKVDKKQMPASKYIATVVNKVKDEKKKKEMLAAFIRMRSKQI
jgi:hypothetical protein